MNGYAMIGYAPNGEPLDGYERYTLKYRAIQDAKRLVSQNEVARVCVFECEYQNRDGRPEWWSPKTDMDPVWFWVATEPITWTAFVHAIDEGQLQKEVARLELLGYRVGAAKRMFPWGYAEISVKTVPEQ